MKWEEVRKIYPNQYVKLQILASHVEGNTKFIDDCLDSCHSRPKRSNQGTASIQRWRHRISYR